MCKRLLIPITPKKIYKMNRIDTILEKERTNTNRIFLYLCQERLMAFGYSAYFATWLFPELEVTRGSTSDGVKFVYTYFPPDKLFSLSGRFTALVGDENIEITVPEEINSYREQFEVWMNNI